MTVQLSYWIHRIRTLTHRTLAGPQLVVVSIQLARIGLLAAYLFASTRLLGTSGYGLLSTTIALAAIGAALVGMGSGIGLVRECSRNPNSFSEAWGVCIGKHILTGLILCIAFVFLATQWLSDSILPAAIVAIGLTELVFAPLAMAAGYAFIAHAHHRTGALLQVLPAVARLVAVTFLWPRDNSIDLTTFSTAVMLSMLAASSLGVWIALRLLPKPNHPQFNNLLRPDYNITHAGSNVVNCLSSEADKIVVYQLTTADQTGIYSAWTRITSALAVPFGALIQSRSHHLFGLGAVVGQAHMRFLLRYSSIFAAYGLGCVLFSHFFSTLLARWLGIGFGNSGPLFLVLTIAVPINGFRQLTGSLLTTSDRAGRRTISDILGMCVFLTTAAAWIPGEGVMGAAKAKVSAELAGLIISTLMLLRARERQA